MKLRVQGCMKLGVQERQGVENLELKLDVKEAILFLLFHSRLFLPMSHLLQNES